MWQFCHRAVPVRNMLLIAHTHNSYWYLSNLWLGRRNYLSLFISLIGNSFLDLPLGSWNRSYCSYLSSNLCSCIPCIRLLVNAYHLKSQPLRHISWPKPDGNFISLNVDETYWRISRRGGLVVFVQIIVGICWWY